MNDEAKELPAWAKAMQSAEPRFKNLAKKTGLNWEEQAGYIRSAIEADRDLQACTPQSIVSAIVNIAATGVSISPMSQYAFLQAQGINQGDKKNPNWIKEMRLKISYRGQIDILTSSGAVNWIRADVVREGDEFKYKGPYALPVIDVDDPFADDRQKIKGGYAVAELPNGTHYCEVLRAEELAEIENASKANFGPWKNAFRPEMIKKASINRLQKTIPRNSQNKERIDAAFSVISQSDGFEFAQESKPSYEQIDLELFSEAVANANASMVYHLSRVHRGQVWVDLVGTHLDTAPKNKKGLFRKAITDLEDTGRQMFQDAAMSLAQLMGDDDQSGAQEILSEFENERASLDELLKGELSEWVAGLTEAA